jgi:hypothetical protein
VWTSTCPRLPCEGSFGSSGDRTGVSRRRSTTSSIGDVRARETYSLQASVSCTARHGSPRPSRPHLQGSGIVRVMRTRSEAMLDTNDLPIPLTRTVSSALGHGRRDALGLFSAIAVLASADLPGQQARATAIRSPVRKPQAVRVRLLQSRPPTAEPDGHSPGCTVSLASRRSASQNLRLSDHLARDGRAALQYCDNCRQRPERRPLLHRRHDARLIEPPNRRKKHLSPVGLGLGSMFRAGSSAW